MAIHLSQRHQGCSGAVVVTVADKKFIAKRIHQFMCLWELFLMASIVHPEQSPDVFDLNMLRMFQDVLMYVAMHRLLQRST
jgi:hypothetical protein